MQPALLAAILVFSAQAQTFWSGWTAWSARPENAARTSIDELHSLGAHGSLAVSGASNPGVFGGWERVSQNIEPGKWYRFRASYRAQGLDYPARQIVPRLDWIDEAGKRRGQPDYPWSAKIEGDWTAITIDAQAPPSASAVKLQLLLLNAPRATVCWDDISLQPVAPPTARPVSVAAINLYPHKSADPVADFLWTLDRSLGPKNDIVLLPEGITVVGTGKSYADVAESIPGPTTSSRASMSAKAQPSITLPSSSIAPVVSPDDIARSTSRAKNWKQGSPPVPITRSSKPTSAPSA